MTRRCGALRLSVFLCTLLTTGFCAPMAKAQLIFNFIHTNSMSQQALDGFQTAANRWSSLVVDNMTVYLDVDFRALGTGVLGETNIRAQNFSYADVRSALLGDSTSADDFQATNHLQASPAFNLLINHTSDNPNGNGSATPYLDNNGSANNANVQMSYANAKALGLIAGNTHVAKNTNDTNDFDGDASIVFSSNFGFDFDPSDGISSGTYDFIGIATHEIGHALGFISGVDDLDYNFPSVPSTPNGSGFYSENNFRVSTLDLYRYSADSVANGNGVIDFTASQTNKYFSLDGGTTSIAAFSTGTQYGDGRQDSHWKDNLGLGIMDPTVGQGELMYLTDNDKRALDVIGYTLPQTPEPSSLLAMSLGCLGLGPFWWRARKRRNNAKQ